MTDAPELIYACYDKEFDATYWVGPDTVYLTRHSVGEYRRSDLPRPQDAARIAELEKALIEVTHPDFIFGALDNVYDAETTLDEYAAAVSRAQRAALEAEIARTVDASRHADPDGNADSRQRGDG